MKRKVLIVTYLWPPAEGVGVMRPLKFAKYLPDHDWEAVVLTVKCAKIHSAEDDVSFQGKVFRTEYKACLAGSGSIIRRLVLIPDEQIGWRKFAVEAGLKIIDEEKIDVIFSTSPPETSHLIGRDLKKHSGLPWVADLRDLWADDHYRQRSTLKKYILRSLEKKVLKDADRIVTVSGPCAGILDLSVNRENNRAIVIENGFDDVDFAGLSNRRNKKFTISYTGKLNERFQPLDLFFKALGELISEERIDKNRIEARFYLSGHENPDVISMAKPYGLADAVKSFGKTSYKDALRIQKESDLLLLIQWQGPGSEGWYSAKLFDYLGSRRPILALAKKGGIVDELIKDTSSGVSAENYAELKSGLSKYYNEYIKNGATGYAGRDEEISRHTRKERAKRLAGIFESLAAKKENG